VDEVRKSEEGGWAVTFPRDGRRGSGDAGKGKVAGMGSGEGKKTAEDVSGSNPRQPSSFFLHHDSD
jgi:hypothetical protein